MKRGQIIGIFVLMLLISVSFVSPLVSADFAGDVGTLMNDIVKGATPIITPILGATPDGQYLFAKFLFFLIVLAIVWTALGNTDFFEEKTWVLALISIASSILATRFLTTPAIIETILLPYTTLGVVITAGLPFVLFFILVNIGWKNQPGAIRRVAWIFFIVVFIGLWATRKGALAAGADGAKIAYIYPITALLALIMILIDGTIHAFFVKLENEKLGKQTADESIRDLRRKIGEAQSDLTNNIITQRQHDKLIKQYQKKIVTLSR